MTFAVTLTFLAGCGSAPEPVDPSLSFEIPPSWTETRLGGPEPDTEDGGAGDAGRSELIPRDGWREWAPPELTLLIEEALGGNPSLTEAASRIDRALAVARTAGAEGLPQVSANADVRRQQFQIAQQSFRQTQHTVSLDVSWELDLWGRVRAGRSAAIADTEAAVAAFEGLRLSLVVEVTRAYLDLVVAEDQFAIAQQDLDSAQSLAERIRERYERGVRPALDLRLTLVSLANAQDRHAIRARILDGARRRLEVLLGRFPSGSLALEGDRFDVPPAPAGLPSDLLERRPDLVEAERAVAAAMERQDAAELALLPRLTLTAAGGSSAAELEDLVDGDFGIWTIAGGIFAPLFQGGRLRAEVDRSRADLEGALARYVDRALLAFSEVASALAAESFLTTRLTALESATEESRASLEISESRYFRGLLDILDLLSARRSFYAERTALIDVQNERNQNRLDLYLALGGGFEREDVDDHLTRREDSSR